MVLAGTATALGVLARAEVLVLAAVLAVTLALFAYRYGLRRAWKPMAASAGCFVLGLAVILVPYLTAIGSCTPSTAVDRLLGRHQQERVVSRTVDTRQWRLDDGQSVSFAAKEPSVSLRRRGYPAAVVQFGRKLADAYGYWIGALALWGVWQLGRRRTGMADRLAQMFFVLFSLVAIRFTAAEGYLVPRHLLTLVVVGLGTAGYGALDLGGRIAGWGSFRRARANPAILQWSVVVLAVVACTPQTLVRHHNSRLGHREAGNWLAERAPPTGKVLDTQGWTGLYCGRPTYRFEEAPAVLSDPDLAYLVVEAREMQYNSPRSRTLHWLIDTAAEPVAEFPDPAARRPNQQPVLLLRWYPDRFRRHVVRRPADLQERVNRHAFTGEKLPH